MRPSEDLQRRLSTYLDNIGLSEEKIQQRFDQIGSGYANSEVVNKWLHMTKEDHIRDIDYSM